MKAVLALATFVALASGATLHEAKPLGSDWAKVGRTDPAQTIRVTFALKKDMSATLTSLEKNSYPGSPSFRKWVSHDEAHRLRPHASPAALTSFLSENGVSFSVVRDVVTADIPVAKIETMFSTTVSNYKNQKTGRVWHRAETLAAPAAVAETVEAVFGLTGMPLPPKRSTVHGEKGIPQAEFPIGPTDIRKRYLVTGRGSGNVKVRQAVAEFQGQFSNQADLTQFFQTYVPNFQKGDDQVYGYRGNQASGYGVEALLDIQYIMGVAPGVKTEFWGWQNFDFCSDLKNWTTTILSDANPPLVFSVSYGWQGDLSQIGCSSDEVNSIDADFATITNRGISIIFASGDSGSGYDGSQLWPSWPASSPYVTSVGATAFTDSTFSIEQASEQFGSGSGFSSMFTVAPWQRTPVAAYLKAQAANLPPSSIWTQGGRATADVSALGEGYNVVIQGQVNQVGGTSASTPTFAAIISLLNDNLVAAGKAPLGHLNPWIYNNSLHFTDVTLGDDKVGRDGSPLDYGFACQKGWDPATGLGTPIFTKLYKSLFE